MEYLFPLFITIFSLGVFAMVVLLERSDAKKRRKKLLYKAMKTEISDSIRNSLSFKLTSEQIIDLPFKSHQILYYETSENAEVYNFISINYERIKNDFAKVKINGQSVEFILLDQSIVDEEISLTDFLKYNAPYIEDKDLEDFKKLLPVLKTKELVVLLNEKFNINLDGSGLMRIDSRDKNLCCSYFESHDTSYLECFFNEYIRIIKDRKWVVYASKRVESGIDELALEPSEDLSSSKHGDAKPSLPDDFDLEVKYSKRLDHKGDFKFDLPLNAEAIPSDESAPKALQSIRDDLYEDYDFDELSIREEIQEKISILMASGRGQVAISIALSILNKTKNSTTTKLSKLRITKEFKIILEDYGNTEIHLTPLQKTLYILFLRYPNGIILKHLVDYKDEIVDIYLTLSNRESIDSMLESINNLVNPLNNSVNEKASRIKEAFISEFIEDIAKNYYLTGSKGEPKKIGLPRELVIWEPTEIAI